jgi:hypothetical protein
MKRIDNKKKSPLLSQKETIRKLNKATRQSRKQIELLLYGGLPFRLTT